MHNRISIIRQRFQVLFLRMQSIAQLILSQDIDILFDHTMSKVACWFQTFGSCCQATLAQGQIYSHEQAEIQLRVIVRLGSQSQTNRRSKVIVPYHTQTPSEDMIIKRRREGLHIDNGSNICHHRFQYLTLVLHQSAIFLLQLSAKLQVALLPGCI